MKKPCGMLFMQISVECVPSCLVPLKEKVFTSNAVVFSFFFKRYHVGIVFVSNYNFLELCYSHLDSLLFCVFIGIYNIYCVIPNTKDIEDIFTKVCSSIL